MNLRKIKGEIFLIFQLFAILTTVFLLSGYGYAGDLPELGKETRPDEQKEVQVKQTTPSKSNNEFEFPAAKTFFPRIYSGYNIDRYSGYLQDIKQVEPILVTLKQVIKSDNSDKVQQFSAKVNVFNLYVADLKDKYGNKQEKNYESFKQLVILDKYLTEAANYQREADKYKKNLRGSLLNKLEDESYLRQKVDMSTNSLDAVLEIIQNAN
ncbi:MAG: hypothetical protein A2039_05215 [Candidatus Melainabacteria bacterium GWA2_34_9]|nr:MAG: hypothetical protein A2039_05215 [Candidatus Melainabacteria bacterium GWA2_34_9]